MQGKGSRYYEPFNMYLQWSSLHTPQPHISGEDNNNTPNCLSCNCSKSSIQYIDYWRGVDNQKMSVIHYKVDVIAWSAPCNCYALLLLLYYYYNPGMAAWWKSNFYAKKTKEFSITFTLPKLMHEKAVKVFSDLVDSLCILAAMIDICLCSDVYSPLTSRPQIWSTRERGKMFQRNDVHMWSVSTHELSKLRDVSYSLCLRAHLSFKGQVLRTNNFVMMEKC